jgi:pimeloyl-ACP methyl ester carboxylesterase
MNVFAHVILTVAALGNQSTTELGIPFDAIPVTDRLGRTITSYLSHAPKEPASHKLPVVLFITGSGCQSIFTKRDKGINSGTPGLLHKLAGGRARILVVEKPGVKFLDTPSRFGSATEGTREFLTEHTLPRWAEANAAALRAVLARPDIDPSKVLVVGHSEGGIVAARVAAEVPAVTHVAPLGCGGPTQLFSLAALARSKAPPGQEDATAEAVYVDWQKILANPESINDFWKGHPYRRWSTFLKSSVVEELKRSKAKIFLAQGTADESESVLGFDVLRAELLAQGRDVTAHRVAGGDHGFRISGTSGGLPDMMEKVLDWFF